MKLIGNGFIAKNLKKIKNNFKNSYLLYCAGVSNSKCLNKKEYVKEVNKIKKVISKIKKNTIFVYISTTSISDKNHFKDKYVLNKIKIENIIKNKINDYIIIRLPQIIGITKNPHVISNFLFTKIKREELFNAWVNSKRNLLDIDDVKKIIEKILKKKFKKSYIVNIYNSKSTSVMTLINIFSKMLNTRAIYKEIKFHSKKKISRRIEKQNKIIFYTKKSYLKKILKKYYK